MEDKENGTGLNRNLTLYGLTMIVIGGCIGSGIFLVQSLRKMIDKEIEISKKVSKNIL